MLHRTLLRSQPPSRPMTGTTVQAVPEGTRESVSRLLQMLWAAIINNATNRFNQTMVSYDASKEERLEALNRKRLEVEERLRD
jgi:hypothetical protein